MSIENELLERSGSKCELCSSNVGVSVYTVEPVTEATADRSAYICEKCQNQIDNPEAVEVNHWRCLNDSMWSEVPAVQVLAWRMLTRLSSEGWPQDLLDMLYLEEETLTWAKATGEGSSSDGEDGAVVHKDINGVTLQQGDTVVLTKDLTVKGTSFTAKRGTAVRNISLVADNADQIEGKVSAQQIVILTQFVKKS